jgi:hypothetical protein
MAAAYTTAASYVVLLIVQGILERKVTGQVIVPLHKTVLIALMYGTINVATISMYALPWFVRWGILAAVMLGAVIVLRNQFLAVYKMIRKK